MDTFAIVLGHLVTLNPSNVFPILSVAVVDWVKHFVIIQDRPTYI